MNKWTDQELMLWCLARGWTCRPDDRGWMYCVHGHEFLVELPDGARGWTAELPCINAQVRELMIGHLMLLGLSDREGNRCPPEENKMQEYTDRQLLEELLRRNGITPEYKAEGAQSHVKVYRSIDSGPSGEVGYSDFYANLLFDKEGALVHITIRNMWE